MNSNKEKLITILVAIYNTPIGDIQRMLDSLFNQTDQNFSVIIVDDGSSKEIKNYLDDALKNRHNFAVIHNKHVGLSQSRTKGIMEAKTKYISFLDADDEVSCRFIEEANNYILQYEPDIIFGNHREVPFNKKVYKNRITHTHFFNTKKDIYEIKKAITHIKNEHNLCISNTICAKIYKTELAKKLHYNEIVLLIGEDAIFNKEILDFSRNLLIANNEWYYYHQNDYSVGHKQFKQMGYIAIQKLWDELYIEDSKFNEEDQKLLVNENLDRLAYYVSRSVLGYKNKGIIEKCKDIEQILRIPLFKKYILQNNPSLKISNMKHYIEHILLRKNKIRIYYILGILSCKTKAILRLFSNILKDTHKHV